MWGAPLEQKNHAQLAVQAALDMVNKLSTINQEWESIVGEAVDFGIGINSGEAQVGNTGSSKKFKYGPLGDVVNVSSRIREHQNNCKPECLLPTQRNLSCRPILRGASCGQSDLSMSSGQSQSTN